MSYSFYDWVKVSQIFQGVDIPQLGDIVIETWNTKTGEQVSTKQPFYHYQGSYSSQIVIQIRGNEVIFDGNISRLNRKDNLFGFSSIDQAMQAINIIMHEHGLPSFTRSTRSTLAQSSDGKQCFMADGARFQRLDVTTNISVGKGNVNAYLKMLATQKVGHYLPHLWDDEKSVTWQSRIKGATRLLFHKAYDKANDLLIHTLPKIKRLHGEDSNEYKYILRLIKHCEEQGIVRLEQEFKNEFLKRHGLNYWGLFKESDIMTLHDKFLKLDQAVKVTAIDLESISEALVRVGACPSIRSANITAIHAINWKEGRVFNGSEISYKRHRAKLRKIGLDIAIPYKANRHNVITLVREKREVIVKKDVAPPSWYEMPRLLKVVG